MVSENNIRTWSILDPDHMHTTFSKVYACNYNQEFKLTCGSMLELDYPYMERQVRYDIIRSQPSPICNTCRSVDHAHINSVYNEVSPGTSVDKTYQYNLWLNQKNV